MITEKKTLITDVIKTVEANLTDFVIDYFNNNRGQRGGLIPFFIKTLNQKKNLLSIFLKLYSLCYVNTYTRLIFIEMTIVIRK